MTKKNQKKGNVSDICACDKIFSMIIGGTAEASQESVLKEKDGGKRNI